MTYMQPMQNYTRSRKNMRSCIGWPPRSLVKWSLNEKKFQQSLMKLIRPLEHQDLRIISLLRRPRSLRQSCSKSKLCWKGLQVQSLTKCLVFRNLLLIKPVQGMISLFLVLLLLVLLFLFLLLIMLNLKTIMIGYREICSVSNSSIGIVHDQDSGQCQESLLRRLTKFPWTRIWYTIDEVLLGR